MQQEQLLINIPVNGKTVSALWHKPSDAMATYVMVHGAGAGMRHPFMQEAARMLSNRGIATLLYQFPYMEAGRKAPGSEKEAMETVIAACVKAQEISKLPLLAGGKSYGGRMTSKAAAENELPGVKGLVFYGFPLHAPGKPGTDRANHLAAISLPMLFLQGTRDKLAQEALIRKVTEPLKHTRLYLHEGADHSFAMLKSSGQSAAEVQELLAEEVVHFAREVIKP